MNDNLINSLEYTVSELSTSIKRIIEDNFDYIRLKAEVGRVSKPKSGHIYLDLKDDTSVISGIIWKGSVNKLNILPEEGLEVVCTGKVTTYAGQSKYQIIIENIEPYGVGALMALLEKRKEKLLKENLDKLNVMADALLKYETIDAPQIDDIMAGANPREPEGWSDNPPSDKPNKKSSIKGTAEEL